MTSEYAREVAKKACLQVIGLNGFDAATEGCLDILADIMQQFCTDVVVSSKQFAEISGRTEVNAKDMEAALDLKGYDIEKLTEFRKEQPGTALCLSVPKFPVSPRQRKQTSFKEISEEPPSHIPDYLPAFPAIHTYKHTTVFTEKSEDTLERALKEKEVRLATEKALVKLEPENQGENPFIEILKSKMEREPDKDIQKILFSESAPNVVNSSSSSGKVEKKKKADWSALISTHHSRGKKKLGLLADLGVSVLKGGTDVTLPFVSFKASHKRDSNINLLIDKKERRVGASRKFSVAGRPSIREPRKDSGRGGSLGKKGKETAERGEPMVVVDLVNQELKDTMNKRSKKPKRHLENNENLKKVEIIDMDEVGNIF